MPRRSDAEVRAAVVSVATAGSHSKKVGEEMGRNAHALYQMLVCDASLFGKAFFGHKKTPAERKKLDRLWKRAMRIAEVPCEVS